MQRVFRHLTLSSHRDITMHRYFIAAVVTATVIITGFTAVPARAGNDDLAKALAGIAALAIIGKVIHDRKDRDQVTRAPQIHYQQPIKPRPLPDRVSRKALPQQCLRQAETGHGVVRVFGARCLENSYRFTNQLPQSCALQVHTQRGWRWAYGARCLRDNGYQIARN